jgi:glycosyltransferase involved in cell wall biosynthesis
MRFVGAGAFGDEPAVRSAIAAAGLSAAVAVLPRVPYDESLRQLSDSDLLLLLQASDDTVGLVPAKLYEYLRTRKPVLALVKEGAITEVLAQTGGGWSADPADAQALDSTLADIVERWRAKVLAAHSADMTVLRRFDRRELTGQLASVFDAACRHTHRVSVGAHQRPRADEALRVPCLHSDEFPRGSWSRNHDAERGRGRRSRRTARRHHDGKGRCRGC